MVKSIKSYLGIIHRLGLLAKSSLASKLTSSCGFVYASVKAIAKSQRDLEQTVLVHVFYPDWCNIWRET